MRISVLLEMLTGQFETDAKRASKIMERRMREMQESAKRLGIAIGSAMAAAGTALAAVTKRAIDNADQLRKMSQSVGISTSALSTLKFAAEQSGVSIETLRTSLARMTINIADAARGTGTAAQAFRLLGIEVRNSDGTLKSNREILGQVAERFAKMQDGAQKTALAVDIFGRSGAQLIPMLNQGADGLAQMEDRARALGLEISDRTAAQAERFNDMLAQLGDLATGLGNDIAAKLLPSLVQYTEQIVEAGIETRKSTGAIDVFVGAVKLIIAGVESARRGVVALVNVVAASVDVVVAAARAGQDFINAYTPWRLVAAATGKEIKSSSQILAEFTTRVNAATSSASTGFQDAVTALSRTFEALFNPTVQDAASATGQMALELNEAEPAMTRTGDAAKTMARALEEARKEADQHRQALMRLEEQAMGLADDLLRAGEDARAAFGGPAEEAALRYRRKIQEVEDALAKIAAQGLATADVLAAADAVKKQTAEEYRDELERISAEQERAAQEAEDAAWRSAMAWQDATDAMQRALERWRTGGIRSFADFAATVKDLFAGIGSAVRKAFAADPAGTIASGLNFLADVQAQRRGGRDGLGAFFAANAASAASSFDPIARAVGQALQSIDALFGGRLFGTGWQPSSSGFNVRIGAGGVSGSQFDEQVRQRSFFRGRQWRRETTGLDGSTLDQLRRAFEQIEQVVGQAARALRVQAPALIEGAFAEVRDAQGRVVSQTSTVLGRTFQESFEQFTRRVTAENLLAVIDRALGNTINAAAGQVAEDLGGAIGDALRPIVREADGVAKALAESGISASQIAERWRANADDLLDGAQFLLAAVGDMRDGVRVLGGPETLGRLVDLVEEMRMVGESLAEAYSRIAASTRLLDEALQLSGVSLDMTREQFVRFATEIADAAGGIERATRLWADYFEMFYSAEERAQAALARAQAAAGRELGDIGLDLGDFAGESGMRAFRALFESLLPTLTPEQVAQWLEAGQALGALNRLLAEMAGGGDDAAEALRALLEEVLGRTQDVLTFAEQIAALDELFAAYIARAIELGATEEQLALIRAQHAREIEALMQAEAEAAAARERAARSLEDYLRVLEAEASGGVTALTSRMRQLQEQYRRHVEQIEELARASGRARASAAELALAQRWYTVQVQRAVADMLAQAQSIIARLYGGGAGAPGGAGEVGAIQDVQAAVEDRYAREMRLLERLSDFIDSLDTSALSPLTPAERLASARRAYEEALAAAQAGDLDALERLPQLAQQYLAEARSYTGGVGGYRGIFEQVQAALAALRDRGALNPPIEQGGGIGGGGVVVEAGASFRELSALERFSLATELTALLRDLLPALGLDLAAFAEQFGVDLAQYLADLGVTLDDMTVQTALRLADIARALGIELTDLATSVGASLGDLGDRQSLINDALEMVIAGLPEEFRGRLEDLLRDIEDATTEADARAAVGRAEAAIRDMPPFIRDLLAPFFGGIASPTDALLWETMEQSAVIRDVRDGVGQAVTVLESIRDLVGELVDPQPVEPPPEPQLAAAPDVPKIGAMVDIDGGGGSLLSSVVELREELRALRAEQRDQAARQDRALAEQVAEMRRAQLTAQRRSAA